jgi:hypothetical protein
VLTLDETLRQATEISGFVPRIFPRDSVEHFELTTITIPDSPPTPAATLYRIRISYVHSADRTSSITVDAIDHRETGLPDLGALPSTSIVNDTEVRFRAGDGSSQPLYVFREETLVYTITTDGASSHLDPPAMLRAIELMLADRSSAQR